MKTLILYGTKHGATRQIAQRLAKQIEVAALIDLKNDSIPALTDYDCVLIGSSIYAGMLRKEAKTFVTQHADELKAKTLGLFLSGMAEDGAQGVLEANYPKDVVAHAKAAALLGCVFDPAKGNFFERFIIRAIAKTSAYTDTISDEKIKQFAEAMKS